MNANKFESAEMKDQGNAFYIAHVLRSEKRACAAQIDIMRVKTLHQCHCRRRV